MVHQEKIFNATFRNLFLFVLMYCLVLTSLRAQEWTILPTEGLEIEDFAADSSGDVLYLILDEGGLWKSENGGETWQVFEDMWVEPHNENYPYYPKSIQVCDPAGDSLILQTYPDLLHNNNWWFSADAGISWEYATTEASQNCISMVSDRFHNDFIVGNAPAGNYGSWLLYSPDFGETWVNYHWIIGLGEIHQDIFHDSTYYRTAGNIVYVSRNMVYEWETMVELLPLIHEIEPSTNRVYGSGVYRLANDDLICLVPRIRRQVGGQEVYENRNYIIRSTDNGVSWTVEENGLPTTGIADDLLNTGSENGEVLVTVNSVVNDYPYTMVPEYIFKSTDFGHTFTCIDTFHSTYYGQSLYKNPYGANLYYKTNETVYTSEDYGTTWEELNLPSVGRMGNIRIAEDHLFLQCDPYGINRIFNYRFSLEEWSRTNLRSTLNNYMESVELPLYAAGDTIISIWHGRNESDQYAFQAVRSVDDGETWEYYGEQVAHESAFVTRMDWMDDSQSRLVMARSDGMYISLDNGVTWNYSSLPHSPMTKFLQSENEIVVEADSYVYRSTNDGDSWEQVGDLRTGYNLWMNPVTGYIYAFGWYWNGEQWIDTGLPGSSFQSLTGIPGSQPLLLGREFNTDVFWKSVDHGVTWEIVDFQFPYYDQFTEMADPVYDPWHQRFWVATTLGPMYLDINDLLNAPESAPDIPLDFSILQVYPNPFNGMTRIRMNLETAGNISLDLFNITGQHVLMIHSGYEMPGLLTIPCDAGRLASGTYFVRLQTGAGQYLRKIQLIR